MYIDIQFFVWIVLAVSIAPAQWYRKLCLHEQRAGQLCHVFATQYVAFKKRFYAIALLLYPAVLRHFKMQLYAVVAVLENTAHHTVTRQQQSSHIITSLKLRCICLESNSYLKVAV